MPRNSMMCCLHFDRLSKEDLVDRKRDREGSRGAGLNKLWICSNQGAHVDNNLDGIHSGLSNRILIC